MEDRFFAATHRVRTGAPIPGITDKIRLVYYALYKQATEGDCKTPKPGFLDWTGRSKWNAWKELEGTSRYDAMRRYTSRLDCDVPGWRQRM